MLDAGSSAASDRPSFTVLRPVPSWSPSRCPGRFAEPGCVVKQADRGAPGSTISQAGPQRHAHRAALPHDISRRARGGGGDDDDGCIAYEQQQQRRRRLPMAMVVVAVVVAGRGWCAGPGSARHRRSGRRTVAPAARTLHFGKAPRSIRATTDCRRLLFWCAHITFDCCRSSAAARNSPARTHWPSHTRPPAAVQTRLLQADKVVIDHAATVPASNPVLPPCWPSPAAARLHLPAARQLAASSAISRRRLDSRSIYRFSSQPRRQRARLVSSLLLCIIAISAATICCCKPLPASTALASRLPCTVHACASGNETVR